MEEQAYFRSEKPCCFGLSLLNLIHRPEGNVGRFFKEIAKRISLKNIGLFLHFPGTHEQ